MGFIHKITIKKLQTKENKKLLLANQNNPEEHKGLGHGK